MTFDQWYFSKVGVTVNGARERGVYAVDLMEQCWEAAVKQAREDALEEAKYFCDELAGFLIGHQDRMGANLIVSVRDSIESLKGKPWPTT